MVKPDGASRLAELDVHLYLPESLGRGEAHDVASPVLITGRNIVFEYLLRAVGISYLDLDSIFAAARNALTAGSECECERRTSTAANRHSLGNLLARAI